MRLLDVAAALALAEKGRKNFRLGAVIKRLDGAIVTATNHHTKFPNPSAHAEARALRKADWGCVLYVARVTADGGWALSKPCKRCQAIIRNRGVKKVYYTIGPNEYGVWYPKQKKEP
jgi:tRNA(Arg) A34 adenosine deaminase TadA